MLDALSEKLAAKSSVAIRNSTQTTLATRGMGGIGKTMPPQLSINHAPIKRINHDDGRCHPHVSAYFTTTYDNKAPGWRLFAEAPD